MGNIVHLLGVNDQNPTDVKKFVGNILLIPLYISGKLGFGKLELGSLGVLGPIIVGASIGGSSGYLVDLAKNKR